MDGRKQQTGLAEDVKVGGCIGVLVLQHFPGDGGLGRAMEEGRKNWLRKGKVMMQVVYSVVHPLPFI